MACGDKCKCKDTTFEQLVDDASRSIHEALLVGGGKEMKAKVHMWLQTAIIWNQSKKKDEK